MKTILVSRFSAFGDVIISVNVIKAIVEQNANCRIVYLTRKPFSFLFEDIERIELVIPDLDNKYKGFCGLYKLSKELKKYEIDAFADIHNSLRTRILRFFLFFQSVKISKINKGWLEKKRLTRSKNKVLKPLKNTAERYADTFRKLGIDIDLSTVSLNTNIDLPSKVSEKLPNKDTKWIGIAPFSMHKQKTYPFDKLKQVVQQLSDKGFKVFIFGGGKNEKNNADVLVSESDNTYNLIGKFKLKDELAVISQMDLMFTPDSANLHLTSLTNTKVLSIWGGTHHFAGFAPYNNPNHTIIEIPITELSCRPCSVFGSKKCFREDWACLNMIAPQTITDKIVELVDSHL